MVNNIILYSTSTCPSCRNLKSQLNNKGIIYEVCDDEDKMISIGIQHIPVLEVDGNRLNYKEALKWIMER